MKQLPLCSEIAIPSAEYVKHQREHFQIANKMDPNEVVWLFTVCTIIVFEFKYDAT